MQETRRRLRGYPDLRASVQQVSLVSGGGFRQTPFNLILRGPDLDRLDAYSQTLVQRLSAIPGFVDVDTAQAQRSPELQVVVDRQRAADLGRADGRPRHHAPHPGRGREGRLLPGSRGPVRRAPPHRRAVPAGRPDAARPDGARRRAASSSGSPTWPALQPGMSPGQIDRYAQERQVTVVANLYQKPLGRGRVAGPGRRARAGHARRVPGHPARPGQADAGGDAQLPDRVRPRAGLHLHGPGRPVRELRPPRHDHALDVPGPAVRPPGPRPHRQHAEHLRDHGHVPADGRGQEERDPAGRLHERPPRARPRPLHGPAPGRPAPGSGRSS